MRKAGLAQVSRRGQRLALRRVNVAPHLLVLPSVTSRQQNCADGQLSMAVFSRLFGFTAFQTWHNRCDYSFSKPREGLYIVERKGEEGSLCTSKCQSEFRCLCCVRVICNHHLRRCVSVWHSLHKLETFPQTRLPRKC